MSTNLLYDFATLKADVASEIQRFVDIKSTAALQFKQLIDQRFKISSKDQQISFAETALSDFARTLLSYGVGNGDHMQLFCSGHFCIPAERFDSQGDYTTYTTPPDFGNRGGETIMRRSHKQQATSTLSIYPQRWLYSISCSDISDYLAKACLSHSIYSDSLQSSSFRDDKSFSPLFRFSRLRYRKPLQGLAIN